MADRGRGRGGGGAPGGVHRIGEKRVGGLAIILQGRDATLQPLLGVLPAVRTAEAYARAGGKDLWLLSGDDECAKSLLDAMPGPLRDRARVVRLDPDRGEVATLRDLAGAGDGALVVVPSDVVVGCDAASYLAALEPPPGGIAVARDGVVAVSGEALRGSRATSLDGLRRDLEREGLVTTRETPGLIGTTSDAASRRAVEKAILRGLRKPLDVEGVVGYFIQRPLTRHVSRLLVRTRLHPNHLSVLAMAVGVLSGVLVATADARWTALGGVLFFAGSLLDCLDGEVARLRFLCSHAGEWLDTLADDLSTLSFLVGMTLNLHARHGSTFLDAVGMVTVLEFVLASAYVYHRIATVHHSGDVTVFRYSFQREDGSSRSRVLWLLKWVVKRDFFSAVFCLSALAGVIEVAFAFSAMGAFGFALAVVVTAVVNRVRPTVEDLDGSVGKGGDLIRRASDRSLRLVVPPQSGP